MKENYALTVEKHGIIYKVPVQCERKKRKTLVLRVYPNTGRVLFSLPLHTPEEYACDFFERQKPWLQKQLAKILPVSRGRQYVSGEKICFLGEELTFFVMPGKVNKVYRDEAKLVLEVKQALDKQKKRQLIEKFFAKEFVLFLDAYFSAVFKKYQHALGIKQQPVLKLRKMTSKWGICRPFRNQITLNINLVHVEPELIEYVLVHELCHFVHTNHGRDFWRLLLELMPDCQERRIGLNELHFKI